MSSTPVMNTNVLVATKATPKSLPIKPKTMQCGIVGFLKKIELEGIIEPSVCETLLTKLPLFETIEVQLQYYDQFDIKHIDQTYIKPRVQAYKKANKPQKEKKARQKKPKAETDIAAVATPTTEENGLKTPPQKEKKEPKKPVKKPRGRQAKETKTEFDYGDDAVKDLSNELEAMNLSNDLEAEKYVKTATPTMPNANVKPAAKPKEDKPKKKRATKPKKEEKPVEELEFWMIYRNETRYWTTDENEKNGDVYSFDGKDKDGDPAPKKKLGKLVDGELHLD